MTKRDWNKDWELTMRATPGPWRWEYNKFYGSYSLIAVKDKAVILDDGSYNGDETPYDPLITPNDPNGQFIAEAREALPYWLQRVKYLEKENERLWAIFKTCPGCRYLVPGDPLGCCHQMIWMVEILVTGLRGKEHK